jgi:hypothetical protein
MMTIDDSLERLMKLHKPPGIRHTAKYRHLDATTGRSLQENCALPRRRSIESTQIYAKIDVAELRQIARPSSEV